MTVPPVLSRLLLPPLSFRRRSSSRAPSVLFGDAMKQIVMKPVADLKPYRRNPRKISPEAVDAVAESIRRYGFRGAVQIEKDGTVINGHTRLKAAKKLGLKEIPCEIVDDLEAEKIREYRLIDNKSAEYSRWDADLLSGELMDLDLSDLDFSFDFSGDVKKKNRWQQLKRLCDLKDRPGAHKSMGLYYHSLFRVGREGRPIEDIKTQENVPLFAQTAAEHVRMLLGDNLAGCGWCLLTTPRRRHPSGFHFATAVCESLSEDLGIPFYPDAVVCRDRNRIDPEFTVVKRPGERNVLLYDDVITTGNTLNAARDLLVSMEYTVMTLVSVDNRV